jgi:hypothetical protein
MSAGGLGYLYEALALIGIFDEPNQLPTHSNVVRIVLGYFILVAVLYLEYHVDPNHKSKIPFIVHLTITNLVIYGSYRMFGLQVASFTYLLTLILYFGHLVFQFISIQNEINKGDLEKKD